LEEINHQEQVNRLNFEASGLSRLGKELFAADLQLLFKEHFANIAEMKTHRLGDRLHYKCGGRVISS